MQWKTITSSLGNTGFGLWYNGQKMLTLAYKPKSDSVYLESTDGEKRLFHYKKKGLFKNKLVLQNEYGAELGKISKEGRQRYIEVEDKRFYLNVKNDNHNVIEIIDENREKPVAVCSVEGDNPSDATNYSLLMVMCFYLFQPNNYNKVFSARAAV
ncbi:hypothetical protein [Niabella beijingensis]|uniref:hypothetical protein n=1 Tax=Niabella beijingensis TaxID=2872700 RepID=UPI001CBE8634|nr:hypothetical protein [Niabella beijingensis]MBZ4190077.1 hypothetical protein [Niabella beijingensis]